jgi:hypothetical protein
MIGGYCESEAITGSTDTKPFGLACFDGVAGLRGLVGVLGTSGLGCKLCMLDSNNFLLLQKEYMWWFVPLGWQNGLGSWKGETTIVRLVKQKTAK